MSAARDETREREAARGQVAKQLDIMERTLKNPAVRPHTCLGLCFAPSYMVPSTR